MKGPGRRAKVTKAHDLTRNKHIPYVRLVISMSRLEMINAFNAIEVGSEVTIRYTRGLDANTLEGLYVLILNNYVEINEALSAFIMETFIHKTLWSKNRPHTFTFRVLRPVNVDFMEKNFLPYINRISLSNSPKSSAG